MSSHAIGPLVPADEALCHQIPDTFATVTTSDFAWTEKICAMAAARDGSLQLGFGLGKYINRNVMDAYAGVSRGTEQITVRSSRRLSPEPDTLTAGPITYEVLEPMKTVRFSLAENECQPIAFEWIFEAAIPPAMEERTLQRTDYRISADLVRYHQIGTARGWVSVDGVRETFTDQDWVSTRDHSWGTRYDVGQPLTDLAPAPGTDSERMRFLMLWSPLLMERSDGERYGVHLHLLHFEAPGHLRRTVIGGIEYPDGRREAWSNLEPKLTFDPNNRRLLGGTIVATTESGEVRPFEIEVLGDTGFHLGAGLYFGYQGNHHGQWRGKLLVEGERIADCTQPKTARSLHQIRDTVIRVTDSTYGGVGYGNCQPIISGEWPELGLSADSSFI